MKKKNYLSDKIKGILLSCSYVSTTKLLHHLESNEMPEEKATWEL